MSISFVNDGSLHAISGLKVGRAHTYIHVKWSLFLWSCGSLGQIIENQIIFVVLKMAIVNLEQDS